MTTNLSDLDTPVSDLKLCVRSRKCMARLSIQTLGQLIEKSSTDLLEVRNFGITCLSEVSGKLAERGLALKHPTDIAFYAHIAVWRSINGSPSLFKGRVCFRGESLYTEELPSVEEVKFAALELLSKEMAKPDERQREIFECLFKAWSENNMPLYGGYCYQEVFELMESFGVDTSEAKKTLDDLERRARDACTI